MTSESNIKKSIEIKSDFINGYYNLGNTLKMLGKLDEAKKNFGIVFFNVFFQ